MAARGSILKANDIDARISRRAWSLLFQIGCRSPFTARYECPLCEYRGAFMSAMVDRRRFHVRGVCPKCKSLARHRLQCLVLKELSRSRDFSSMRVLHFAPEPQLGQYLKSLSMSYETADIRREGVDHVVDMRKLSLPDRSYDLVFASHVLEHIGEDLAAMIEVWRVLRTGGMAVLPVPILGERTVEYSESREYGHVRAPGYDYFERYRAVFSRVEVSSSSDFPAVYQTRSRVRGAWLDHWGPMPHFADRTRSGYVLTDFVPVCFV